MDSERDRATLVQNRDPPYYVRRRRWRRRRRRRRRRKVYSKLTEEEEHQEESLFKADAVEVRSWWKKNKQAQGG